MTITLTNAWPASEQCGIPLPYIEYTGQPRNVALTGSDEDGRIYRRSRYSMVYYTIQVRWVLTTAHLDAFKEFFEQDLKNGIAHFSIPLRYPKNSVLTDWEAAFIGGFSTEYNDGMWMVNASLNLVRPTTIANRAAAL